MGQTSKPMPTSDIPKRKQELFNESTRAGSPFPTPAVIRADLKERAFDSATKGLKIPAPGKDVNLPYEGSAPQQRARAASAAKRPLYSDKEAGPALVSNRDYYRKLEKRKATRRVSSKR